MSNSFGQGSIGFSHKIEGSGPPFDIDSANNGVSVDPVSEKIVLGQAPGEAGDPGAVITNREIKLSAGTVITFVDSTGAVIGIIDNDNQIISWGYDLFVVEPDRMTVAGPVAGVGEGVEIKGAVRLNLTSQAIFIPVAPQANVASCDILVRNTGGGATGTRVETITGASGNFTTVDGKTVTVTRGIITSIV